MRSPWSSRPGCYEDGDDKAPDAAAAAKAVAERGQRLYDIITGRAEAQRLAASDPRPDRGLRPCDPGLCRMGAAGPTDKRRRRAAGVVRALWDRHGLPSGLVDTAFTAMAEALTDQQVSLMMRLPSAGPATPVFLLPERLQLLRPG